jgi:hypothetical protein
MMNERDNPEFRRRLGDLSEVHLAEAAAERELAKLYETHGLPAGKVTARHVDDDVLVCFLEDLQLTPADQILIDNGKAEEVLESRRLFQGALGSSLRDAVERATGRRVKSFSGVASTDPPMNIEIFFFEPPGELP